MITLRTLGLRGAIVLTAAALVGGAAMAPADATDREDHRREPTTTVDTFVKVTRETTWTLTDRLTLDFPTFHTEGMAVTSDRIFVSAVEILEPTVKFPAPQDGYDRTPGKGVGHLFVTDLKGNLIKDIHLGEGDMYHPGGIDFDGHDVWVPVAQYRPNSSSIIYSVDARSLEVSKRFEAKDHFGGIVHDRTTDRLVGNTWGSRRFTEWNLAGKVKKTWENTSFFVDYQDCQYAARAKMFCAGVTNLPQTPAAGGAKATYELGGIALIDLKGHGTLREIPFQQWSSAGHVATRNPFTIAADGGRLIVRVAPDNGEEGNGTEILTYEATVD